MPQFTEGELEVMKILWEHGEMKPAEIQKNFPRPIKNSALRSYLTILHEKGHITRDLRGKAYFYKAKTQRDSAFHHFYQQMVDSFWDGSSKAFLRHLIKSEKLSDKELIELKRMAEEE